MDDNSTNYQYSFDELNESLQRYGESLSNNNILIQIIKKNYIQKYIVDKLFSYYLNYNNIIFLSNRKYANDFPPYFTEYYIINYDWMENFLKYYHYDSIIKIIKLIEVEKIQLHVEELDKKIREFEIEEDPGNDNIIKNGLRTIDFSPRKEKIPENIYVNFINGKKIEYFNNFIIVNKELYDKLRQDDENTNYPNYSFDFEKKALICLVDNIFIYKIEHNILGVGILPEQSDLNTILKFEIEFFIIMEEYYHYNSKSEIEKIFQIKDLEKYLTISRNINFSNIHNNKLEIKQENQKIGFL